MERERVKVKETRFWILRVARYMLQFYPLPVETVSQRHCEGVKRPKQSHKELTQKEIAALPLVARNDRRDYDTAPEGRGKEE